ncbi:MAG: hypothetical protein II978_05850, partial [Clostridia bacterium]|nr:hypothetical protein [Clostridia bacterium]
IAAVIAVCTTASFAAFAEYDPNKEVNPNQMATKMVKPVFVVNVNGKLLEGAQTYVNEKDRIMLPIRAIAEELGFTVGWDSGRITLTKGPVYVTFAIGEDGYTFARTAPMQIGQAPELTDEKTYVPSNFFDEILGGEININQNGQIEIKHGEEVASENEESEEEAAVAGLANVISVTEGVVLVNDEVLGEVQLNIGEETEIILADGEKGSVADIKEGMALTVEYGAAMTMSLPPQNNPVKITVKEAEEVVEEELKVKGEITDAVVADSFGNIALTVKTEDNANEEMVLIVSEETKVTKGDAEMTAKDLVKGVKIEATHSMAMTMSIPPQVSAISINIVE